MFKRIQSLFDAIWDRMNPIMVRDLRRLDRMFPLSLCGLLYAVLFLVVITTDHFLSDKNSLVGTIPLTIASFTMLGGYMGILFSILWPITHLIKSKVQYELFEFVPLSAKDRVQGIFFTTLTLSIFAALLLLPAHCITIRYNAALWNTYEITKVILNPTGMVLLACSCTLYILSYFSRINTWKSGFLAFACACIGIACLIAPMMILCQFDATDRYINSRCNFVAACVSAVIILSLTVFVGYALSVHHFSRRHKTFWGMVLLNWLISIQLGTCFFAITILILNLFGS